MLRNTRLTCILNILLCLCFGVTSVHARENDTPNDSCIFVTNSVWSNWFGQIGADMTLQNPYGTNFANVFPNGKTFGLDVAIGKWFTPQIGVRAKLNLENTFLRSDHAVWVKKCENGYLTLNGDLLVNIHNFFGDYKPDRFWNLTVFPRAGAFISLGSGKGSPILGLGIGNTFRMKKKRSLYTDVAYQVVTSVIGATTDTGSGSNGYFDINVGVQYNLGRQDFHRTSECERHYKYAVKINPFWDNWFVQFGIGMSLLNPYGRNFAKVIPNGSTVGINMGFGKWFTPDFGARIGANWQNGIIGNNRLDWLDQEGRPSSNHKGGGYVAAYVDALLNLHNLFGGYNENCFWNAMIFPRAGLDSNLEGSTGSPLVGIGTEQTFKLSDRIKLYADVAYQVTSSEFMNGKSENEETGSGSNGWFDLNVGIQYEFGKNWWEKPSEKRILSHWEGGHNWPRFIVNTGASVVVAFGAKTVLKAMVKEERPDHSDNKSFSSGHAAMAFAAARSIDKEFRKDCI